MQKRIPIKNHYQEINLTARRSLTALAFILVLISLLIARLAYLQIIKHEMYSTLSTKNWLDLVPVEPTRGLIYDRNGNLLADNVPVFSLDVIPIQAPKLDAELIQLKTIISLSDEDIVQFKRQLKQHRRFEEIPLKLRLTDNELANFSESQYRFPGIFIKARLMRNYPYDKSFSHVLGYVGRISAKELNEIDQINYSASHYIGKLGIEKYYEEELHGKVGYGEVENDASGKPLRTLNEIKSIPGKNIYLTLDSNLQFVAEKALQGHRGAIVAIQPSTGQVLAMVSEPAYDPNLFVIGISQKDYAELQSSPDRPLFDRATRGLYPPASTIKPFVALAGLDANIISPDTLINDPGWYQLKNSSHVFHDWKRYGHGNVNLRTALAVSCDIYFYDLASKLGIKRMDNMLARFGLGAATGIDLDHELNGVLASPEWKEKFKGSRWYEGDTVISGIGQGFMQFTPLQLANATAALAMRGQRFMPYLMLAEQMPGETIEVQKPIALEDITLPDKQYWNAVIAGMQDVVPLGTGRPYGKNYSYTIASKTGTAQVTSRRRNPEEEDNQNELPERLRDHHWFIAFAPVEKPAIAIAVITENSSMAINAARQVLDYYLGTQNANRPFESKIEKATT